MHALHSSGILLALCPGEAPTTVVALQSTLGVEASAVESWVVRAIGKKLLEARIDQPAQKISIIKCTLRTFSEDQWTQLRSQLAVWRVRPFLTMAPESCRTMIVSSLILSNMPVTCPDLCP
jgi:PCI domain